MTKQIDKEVEFLYESNKIEREYDEIALSDALLAWKWAKENKQLLVCEDVIERVEYALYIHRLLMRVLAPEIAGKIRRYAISIGGETRDGVMLKDKFIELCKKIDNLKTEQDIKQWHIEFEKIHPFADGNGRTGRILMNIQRLVLGFPLYIIHEGEEQMKYYRWFR